MTDEEIPTMTLAEALRPKKTKKKTLSDPDGIGVTQKQIRLLSKLPDMLEGKKTLAQITIESGYCRDIKNASMVGERELTKLKKAMSKNDLLLDAFNLKGASLEEAAQTMADMLKATTLAKVSPHAGNVEGVREIADNKVRNNAAQFIIQAHGAMPERVVVNETRTFEQKLAIVKIIKENPGQAIDLIRQKMISGGGDE